MGRQSRLEQASHAFDEAAERSVLGAILSAACVDRDAGWRIVDRALATGLLPEHFFLASHGEMFATLVRMRHGRVPVDPISVAHELGVCGADALTRGRLWTLAHEVVATNTVERHAQIVRDLWVIREGTRL
jgi:replicative DNA helicase